jgi:hypothetical protein
MISRDLLGRAHAALSVSPNGGPCTGVLREILSSIEGHVPEPGSTAVALISAMGSPTLVYVSPKGAVNLGEIDAQSLRNRWGMHPVELRFMQALLVHALGMLDQAIQLDETPEG